MKRNKLLYLIASIGFDLAAIVSFINYFTGDNVSNIWLILGCAAFVVSIPMIMLFSKEKIS